MSLIRHLILPPNRANLSARMHQFTGKIILMLIVVSFLLGVLVVTLNPDYTIEKNVRSNRNYYPSIKIGEPSSKKDADPQEVLSGQGY